MATRSGLTPFATPRILIRTMADSPASEPASTVPPGLAVRRLLRRSTQAALATALARDGSGRPYASLVLVALDLDASPLLLLSDLADHSANLRAEPRAALLFDGTAGLADPLAGPRATLIGRIVPVENREALRRLSGRFLARHPTARQYAGFGDFRLYRMDLDKAHMVAGFGRIHWLEAGDVLLDPATCEALAQGESELVEALNRDKARNLQAIAQRALAPAPGAAAEGSWALTGLDPEGLDLHCNRDRLRVDFPAPVADAAGVRAALERMAPRPDGAH